MHVRPDTAPSGVRVPNRKRPPRRARGRGRPPRLGRDQSPGHGDRGAGETL